MSQNLRQAIIDDYVRCSQDPAYFMKKYCFIQHPKKGKILFNLYDFQAGVLHLLRDNPYQIILKSRQLGISTLAAGYSLWLMTFHENKNCLCIATKQETARNMVTKVKFMYDNLPSWLKVPFEEKNKLSLRLKNGSQIKATSAAGDAGRSEAVSYLIIDEAAFIDNIEHIWASAQQTLATGGGATVLSTPFGTGNWFHKMWSKAEAKENQFVPIKLKWDVHPERNQEWRDSQDTLLGDPRLAAQECDCDFNTSGDTVIPPEELTYIEKNTIAEPYEKRGYDKALWIWKPVDYSKNYLMIVDVARGDGKDYSTVQVIELESNEQVAEYKGQISPKDLAYFARGLAVEYNEAILVVENNSYGWSTIQTLIEMGYNKLYYSPKNSNDLTDSYFNPYNDNTNMIPGFVTSMKTRPILIGKLQEYINERSLIIRSKRTLGELRTFIWKNGRPEAQQGYNDDLVIPLGIGMYLRDTALITNNKGIEMTKNMLNNIQVNKTYYQGGYNGFQNDNPYNINTPYGDQNVNWLL